MKSPLLSAFAIAVVIAAAPSQDVLHYKFDERCGAEVINFAPSAVANGAIVTNLPGGASAARVAGQFDQALTGSAFPGPSSTTHLVTGWAPTTTTGNFSFASWIRNRPGNPTAIAFGYLFGATGGNLRLFTGSSGRMFLSGFPGGATSAADLTPLLNAGWVHIACTVDAAALQATWYINGVADPAVTFTGAVALAGTNFAVGSRSSTGSNYSPLDTDEFLWSDSVWTAAEVLALAAAPRAADGDYTSDVTVQCGGGSTVVSGVGGEPFAGNLSYGLSVATATPSLFLLLVGFDRCLFNGAVPLPLDGTPLLPLLNGCFILADAPVIVSGTALGSPATVPFPLPATVPASTNLYVQSLSLDLATTASTMSFGFAISTGS
jgi:hypothetical protein